MSIYKHIERECWVEYTYNRRYLKKTFYNHLERKQWVFKVSLDDRYQVLNHSK